MAEFDTDTEVRERSPGEYDADLGSGWVVGGGVNGGYLLADDRQRHRAAPCPRKPDPIAISAYYLSASAPGPATVTTRVLRDGRSVATVAADLVQGDDARGSPRWRRTATWPAARRRPDHGDTARPAAARGVRRQRRWRRRSSGRGAPLLDRFDMRFDPDSAGWAVGKPSGAGVIQAWFRLADDREPDPLVAAARRRRAAAGHLRARAGWAGRRPSSSPPTCGPARRPAG